MNQIVERIMKHETTATPSNSDQLQAQAESKREGHRIKFAWKAFLGDTQRNPSFDNFKVSNDRQREVRDGLMQFCDDIHQRAANGEGLLLYGPCGTGKDHLACAVLRHAIVAGHSVKRINGCEFFGDIRDSIDGDKRTERSLMEELTYPVWLLISDPLPPKDALTNHQTAMLYRIIERRSWSIRPTIVTVNVKDGDEGSARMGSPTWDRLKENAWVVACNWPSHRKPSRVL